MTTMKQLLLALALVLCGMQAALAQEPVWRDYDALLAQYVAPAQHAGMNLNWVNYSGLKQDPRFATVVARLEGFPLSALQTREEQLAFYLNAYNILALKTVLDHWPVKSIKDAGSLLSPVWKKPAGRIGGKTVSLDEIEHKTLRPMGEPRIRMAIVCASISCPDLRTEAYAAARLDAQLDDQARRFLANPAKGLAASGNTVRVSKILDWFGKDFEKAYGSTTDFVRRYAVLPGGAVLKADLPYDWSLNGE
jgi:hypothetical protein